MSETPERGARHLLLKTAQADLPDGLADQVARACEPVADVRSAYIARQRETPASGGPSREILAVALELTQPPTQPGEPRTREVIRAVIDTLPLIDGHKSVAVLAEAALPAWSKKAVRVFDRHEGCSPGARSG